MRIAKAVREGKDHKCKALQWILSHSFSAKLLAVKKVTSNKGAKTPGVDGITWNTKLVRYIKIKGEANPYNPEYSSYFVMRRKLSNTCAI